MKPRIVKFKPEDETDRLSDYENDLIDAFRSLTGIQQREFKMLIETEASENIQQRIAVNRALASKGAKGGPR